MSGGLEEDVERRLDSLAIQLIPVAHCFLSSKVAYADELCTVHEEWMSASGQSSQSRIVLLCSKARLPSHINTDNHFQLDCQCEKTHDGGELQYEGLMSF